MPHPTRRVHCTRCSWRYGRRLTGSGRISANPYDARSCSERPSAGGSVAVGLGGSRRRLPKIFRHRGMGIPKANIRGHVQLLWLDSHLCDTSLSERLPATIRNERAPCPTLASWVGIIPALRWSLRLAARLIWVLFADLRLRWIDFRFTGPASSAERAGRARHGEAWFDSKHGPNDQ